MLVWPAIGSLLPELASHFALHGELASQQEHVSARLLQQHPIH